LWVVVTCDAAPNGDVSGDDARSTDAAPTSPRLRDVADEDSDADEMAGARSRRRRHGVSNNNWKTDEDTDDEPKDTYKYQRRRSRAVLYQLSGSYGAQRSTKGKLQLTKVRGRDGTRSRLLTRDPTRPKPEIFDPVTGRRKPTLSLNVL